MTSRETADTLKVVDSGSSEVSSADGLTILLPMGPQPAPSTKRGRHKKSRLRPMGRKRHQPNTRKETGSDATESAGRRQDLFLEISDMEACNRELLCQTSKSSADVRVMQAKLEAIKQKHHQAEQERSSMRQTLEGLRYQLEWPEADLEDYDHYACSTR